MDPRPAISALGRRQHQLVTTWQLALLRISDRQIAQKVARRDWSRPATNVIALTASLTPVQRLAAAVLSLSSPHGAALRVEALVEQGLARTEAVAQAAWAAAPAVAGRSALWLHGIGNAPDKHWLRLPEKGPGSGHRPGTVVRYGPLTGPTLQISGLPCVDVPQAFMDIPGAREHPSTTWLHHDLSGSVARAAALRAMTLSEFSARLDDARRFVGAPVLRAVLADLRGELTHSATEKVARRCVREVLAAFRLDLHPEPYAIRVNERIVGEADIPILALRLDIEVDGPHHQLPDQQRKDQLRDRAVRRASWEVERFPTSLIDLSPQRFKAEMAECISARVLVVAP